MFRLSEELTPEVRDDCYQWCEQHLDELPKSLALGDGMYISDVRSTVQSLMTQLKAINWERAKIYRGTFALLSWIRQKCMDQGIGAE